MRMGRCRNNTVMTGTISGVTEHREMGGHHRRKNFTTGRAGSVRTGGSETRTRFQWGGKYVECGDSVTGE